MNVRDLVLHIESQWKLKRGHLARNGVNDAKEWAASRAEVIALLNVSYFGIESEELRSLKLHND